MESTSKVYTIDTMNTVFQKLTITPQNPLADLDLLDDSVFRKNSVTMESMMVDSVSAYLGNCPGTPLPDLKGKTLEEVAHMVRRYFQDKWTIQALRGHTMSEFRTKAMAWFNEELTLDPVDHGMAVLLPYFYHEDRCIDHVMSVCEPLPTKSAGSDCQTLTPVTWYSPYRKNTRTHPSKSKTAVFWYRDVNTGAPFMVKSTSPEHTQLLKSIYQATRIRVKAEWIKHSSMPGQPGVSYFEAHKLQLLGME